jgi:hypothetical protein
MRPFAALLLLCLAGLIGAQRSGTATLARSGILTCAVDFPLAAARNLSPGRYTGDVNLALDTH